METDVIVIGGGAAGLMCALTAGRRDGRHQLRFYERSLDERTRTGLALDRDLRLVRLNSGAELAYAQLVLASYAYNTAEDPTAMGVGNATYEALAQALLQQYPLTGQLPVTVAGYND